jgi:hypothetical protein
MSLSPRLQLQPESLIRSGDNQRLYSSYSYMSGSYRSDDLADRDRDRDRDIDLDVGELNMEIGLEDIDEVFCRDLADVDEVEEPSPYGHGRSRAYSGGRGTSSGGGSGGGGGGRRSRNNSNLGTQQDVQWAMNLLLSDSPTN